MAKKSRSWALEALTARTNRDPAELLRELYIEKRHSQQEIADALGVSRTAVTAWLADFGISRDDRPSLEPLTGASPLAPTA